MLTAQAITTPTLLDLARAADRTERNRRLDTEALEQDLDPDGFHVIDRVLLHNDVEWRCVVLMKMRGTSEPVRAYLDVSFEDWSEKVEPESKKLDDTIGLTRTERGFRLG